MIEQILWALGLASVTVTMHVFGAVRLVLPWARASRAFVEKLPKPRVVSVLIRLVSGLLVLHVAEMALWAAAFWAAGLFGDFETALYFSLTSYTTVGYGDILPPHAYRLLGPIEAAVGVLMLGISTSIIIAAVQRMRILSDEHYPHEPNLTHAPPKDNR
jgi:hypothetical protein